MKLSKAGLPPALLCALLGLCSAYRLFGQTPGRYGPDDTWRVSTPEEQGVDSRALLEALRNDRTSPNDFHSLLIIRNGYLIVEAYWAPYHRDTTHNIKSASKSVISALTGIALREGYLRNLRQTVGEFFPEYAGQLGKQEITLQNLLTMTAGIDWMEDSGPSPFDLDNWKKLPMSDAPGKTFVYNTMLTHMMSAIITKSSGLSTKDFADKYLFRPLGIKNYQWTRSADGYYHGGSDVFLTPLDMAKFGYLYLNDGSWNGKQVIPQTWVKESTTKRISAPSDLSWAPDLGYGYWWWLPGRGFMAWGAGGQYIMVRPDLKTVIVITAHGLAGGNNYLAFAKSFLENEIFPAIKSHTPLPPDPEANQEMKSLLRKMEDPAAEPIPAMPKTAAAISGKDYDLEPNTMGSGSFSLLFGDKAECSWRLEMDHRPVDYQVGLDGRYKISRVDVPLGVNPEGDRVACRGRWTSDDTFSIDFHIIGDPSRQKIDLRFKDDRVAMNITAPGLDVLINGKRNKSR
jgi:CubicO group peptidase (beta-lactamase class C family)